MTVEMQPKPKPWQLMERLKRWDSEKSRRNQGRILAAYDSLVVEGIVEVSGYEIAKRDAELRHPDRQDVSLRLMPYGTLYRGLSQLERQGILTSQWGQGEYPRRRLYLRVNPVQTK